MKDFVERLCSYAFKSFKETCPLHLHDIYIENLVKINQIQDLLF